MVPKDAQANEPRSPETEKAISIASVDGATKAYGATVALSEASFSLAPGEVRALIGKNGAGKSTLIKLLSGAELPDKGTITISGELLGNKGVRCANRLGVQTVYQELSLVPEMTVAENLFLGRWPSNAFGINTSDMRSSALGALSVAGLESLNPEQTVGALDLATQQLVEIARALLHRPKVLILDEPTSSLGATEVTTVLSVVKRLSREGVAIIYVSHRMNEIREICDSVTVMRDGLIIDTFTVGERSTSDIVHLMLGEASSDFEASGEYLAEAEVILKVTDLAVPPKLTGVNFTLRRGEVLGISGLLGAGRSELLRAIAGVEPLVYGEIEAFNRLVVRPSRSKMQRLGIGFTPEDRKSEGIIGPLSITENIVLTDWRKVSRGPALSVSIMKRRAQKIIASLRIRTEDSDTPIMNLSGGNQQKAVIGRWLHAESPILLLDEPTRGVDVEAKTQIYDLIRELSDNGTSIIFVSSEDEELVSVCDRILVLRDGRLVREFRAPAINLSDVVAASMSD